MCLSNHFKEDLFQYPTGPLLFKYIEKQKEIELQSPYSKGTALLEELEKTVTNFCLFTY